MFSIFYNSVIRAYWEVFYNIAVRRDQFNLLFYGQMVEQTRVGWSVGIIKIIISNSRVGRKILKKGFSLFLPLLSVFTLCFR